MSLEAIVGWATAIVERLGPVGVAAMVTLENLFPPIPSELILPLAGFVSATDGASLPMMISAAMIGSLAGALILYGLAAAFGPVRLRGLVRRHGRWLGLTEEDLDRSEKWFDQRSARAVLICRCIPLMRSLISIPAGLRRMPLLSFVLYTLAGSLIWNVALVMAGYLLGENWEAAGEPVELLQMAVLALIAVAMGWFAWRRLLAPRLKRSQ